MGIRPVKTAIQVDSMDADLRAGLWNVFRPRFVEPLGSRDVNSRDAAIRRVHVIWDELLKRPSDEAPTGSVAAAQVFKPGFISGDYMDVYDLVDFTVQSFGRAFTALAGAYNSVLEREVSGYRFVAGILTPISNEYELQAIEDALAASGPMSGAATHLQTALHHLSDRDAPDYRNSIKESISAVESAARAMTGSPKATLGELLPVLERSGRIHPAQKDAFSKLYGYTSDEGGIRHAMLDASEVDFADAKYMLAVCAAFLAYVASRT